jgi:hypothetical protein
VDHLVKPKNQLTVNSINVAQNINFLFFLFLLKFLMKSEEVMIDDASQLLVY